jgi:hypothetical protein
MPSFLLALLAPVSQEQHIDSSFLAPEPFDRADHGSTTPPPPIGHPPALTRMATVGNIPQKNSEQFEFVSSKTKLSVY